MIKTIGFANTFYTLWEVSEPYKVYTSEYSYYMKQDCLYLKNLSKDLETAKAKMGGDYVIDLTLRGHSSFERKVSDTIYTYEDWQFPVGRHTGEDIRECDDVNALWWMFLKMKIWNNEFPAHSFKQLNPHWVRPVVYARRRLIDLGELVRYNKQWMTLTGVEYAKKNEAKTALENGHHYADGERVELRIKLIDTFYKETDWGSFFIHTYASEDGKLFKYAGNNPPLISDEEFEPIKGTIKHHEYQGVKETRLQRIKTL